MRLVRKLLCASWLCVSLCCLGSTSVVGVAHANQVRQPPPPPPTAPTPVAPAPVTAPPTSPEPKPVVEEQPLPPPPPTIEPAPTEPAPVPPPPVVEEQPVPPPPPPASTPDDGAQTTVDVGLHASTPDAAESSHPETHEGFFLRLALGLGVQAWSKQLPSMPPEDVGLPEGGGEATFGGVGGALEIAIGAVITENLALHATMFGASLGEPTLTVSGRDLPDEKGRAFLASMLGVGATYYFMPVNIYVSGSFGLGGMRMVPTAGGKTIDTKAGFAWELLAGKEWWVSDEWGLGAALQVAYVNVPDEGERSTALSVNAFFSATYN